LLREKLALQGGGAGLTEIKSLREQLAESEKLRTAMTRSVNAGGEEDGKEDE